MTPEEALRQEATWAMQSASASAKPEMQQEYRFRAANYQPRPLGNHTQFHCPKCWVRDGVKAILTPAPGTDEYDVLRCHTCHSDLVVPFE